jgi:hypothetical protein
MLLQRGGGFALHRLAQVVVGEFLLAPALRFRREASFLFRGEVAVDRLPPYPEVFCRIDLFAALLHERDNLFP